VKKVIDFKLKGMKESEMFDILAAVDEDWKVKFNTKKLKNAEIEFEYQKSLDLIDSQLDDLFRSSQLENESMGEEFIEFSRNERINSIEEMKKYAIDKLEYSEERAFGYSLFRHLIAVASYLDDNFSELKAFEFVIRLGIEEYLQNGGNILEYTRGLKKFKRTFKN